MNNPAKKQTLSSVHCSIQIKAVTEDDHIYHFDDTWNITIDNFCFSKHGDDKLKVQFDFQSNLHDMTDDGRRVTVIPHEGLEEFQPQLEKLEILLDIMSLHTGVPLAMVDGSYEFRGGGFGSRSNPVTNSLSLHDVRGLEKRYNNVIRNDDLGNAIRLFRLALIDKEFTGKGIKFWAALEALYRKEKEGIATIWSTLNNEEQKSLTETIQSLSSEQNLKDKLIGALKYQKVLTDKEVLSEKIMLMNSAGDIPQDDIKKLLRWWSEPRNMSAHGQRIKRDDETRHEAIDDLEDTMETLLQTGLSPSMHAYFIGHPNDVDGSFWDEKNHIINKVSQECWVHPTGWGNYLLENIGKHKISNNCPLVYVSHDKVIEITADNRIELEDISRLPKSYQETIVKIQKKLNQDR